MKNLGKKTKLRENKAITLIALVVTIVVLLVLAGISLNLVLGENGIITRAQEAKIKTEADAVNTEAALDGLEKELEVALEGTVDTWDSTEEVNAPNLLAGMTGIYWNGTTETEVTETNKSSWYDYSSKLWANAKTSDGSYWVWIPRYEYSISGETVDVKFIPVTKTTADAGYTIHPAFQNGGSNNYMNGEWSKELPGIWVAKFEMSMETNGEHTDTNNATAGDANNGNILTSTTVKAVSKPGVSSWRYISIGNSYTNAYNYNRSYDSHLMKNSEWGAVAYLTQSSYGKTGEVWINNSSKFITGSCGDSVSANETTTTKLYTEAVNASTTGNVTGIYDMSGGAWEKVAGYITNGNTSLNTYGSSFVATITANADGYKTLSTPYATVYPYYASSTKTNETSDTETNNYNAYKALKTSTYGYGDAVLETSTAGSGWTGWAGELSNFPYNNTPFFLLGGRIL